jgi:hypothetical protein
MKAIGVMSNDEQTASAAFDVAAAATQMLTLTETLALRYGPEAARDRCWWLMSCSASARLGATPCSPS